MAFYNCRPKNIAILFPSSDPPPLRWHPRSQGPIVVKIRDPVNSMQFSSSVGWRMPRRVSASNEKDMSTINKFFSEEWNVKKWIQVNSVSYSKRTFSLCISMFSGRAGRLPLRVPVHLRVHAVAHLRAAAPRHVRGADLWSLRARRQPRARDGRGHRLQGILVVPLPPGAQG